MVFLKNLSFCKTPFYPSFLDVTHFLCTFFAHIVISGETIFMFIKICLFKGFFTVIVFLEFYSLGLFKVVFKKYFYFFELNDFMIYL